MEVWKNGSMEVAHLLITHLNTHTVFKEFSSLQLTRDFHFIA